MLSLTHRLATRHPVHHGRDLAQVPAHRRAAERDGRDLMARGTVIHRGRSTAIGTSEVFDADGKKVAVATGSSVILPGRPATVTTELALPGPGY
jgi:acyl-coenzyme A thioesterase PaaI-like protein